MKSQFVRELAVGAKVDSTFVLSARELRSSRTGEAYLSLEFADRTGRIPAVQFRPSSAALGVPADTIVRVGGIVTSYRGVKRVSVEGLVPAATNNPSDFLPGSERPLDEVRKVFRTLANSVSDSRCRSVLKAVFGDKEFFERFCRAPGAQVHHHAYVQGLIEHTVSVAGICRELGRIYPEADTDLLVTSALLHDIGKVDELEYETSIRYSDSGRLVGHVVLGERRMRDACRRLRLPESLMDRLSHAVLSHHGELEWGAPKRPSTLEALLLHHADNLDAKANGFTSLMSGASSLDERWTDSDNLFRRPLYAPLPAEQQRRVQPTEDEQYASVS